MFLVNAIKFYIRPDERLTAGNGDRTWCCRRKSPHLGQVEHFSVFCRDDENLGIVVHRVNLAVSEQSEKNAICTFQASNAPFDISSLRVNAGKAFSKIARMKNFPA